MIKWKRMLSLVLAFAMMVSLFTGGPMPVFAVESEPTLTAVPAGVTPTEESLGTQVAYVANDTVTVYEYYENGAWGMVCTGALGEQLELTEKFTYTVEGVETVIYHFADSDFAGAMGAADDANYQFILASDVTFTAPEVTPTPEPTASPEATPTPEPTTSPEPTATPSPTTSPDVEDDMSGIVDYGSVDFNAYIIPNTLTFYKNHIDDVDQKVVENVAGEEVHAYFFYELENGTVKFKVEYAGENTAVSTAIAEGYTFVKSTDVAKVLADSTTGVSVSGSLPEDVSVTVTPADVADLPLENADVTIGEKNLFYDVTLYLNDAEYQPENGVTITFPAEKVPFASGTIYYAYHVKNDGTVETYGPFNYDGGDIAVEFGSLSYVGIAEESGVLLDFVVDGETPEGVNLNYPTATITKESVNIYEYYTYNSQGVQVGNVQGEEIELLLSFTYSNNEIIYQYAYRNETHADLKDAAVTYYFISADDVKLAGEGPTEDEITEAYNELMKSATVDEFDAIVNEIGPSGIIDYFSEEQLTQLDGIYETLCEIEEKTIDWDEYEVKAQFNCDTSKLYLNPVTMPEEFVTVNVGAIATSLEDTVIIPEEFTVEGKYIHEETGVIYYILDTSAWKAFVGITPYQFALASDIAFTEKWTELDGKAVFTVDSVGVYDNTYSTYNLISDGLSREAFDVLYSFEKDNYDGTVTPWYLVDTTGWVDAYGNEIRGVFVKQEDVKYASNAEIAELYNSLLNAVTAEEYNKIYAKAKSEGMDRFLDEEQQTAVSGNQEILETIAANTQDVSSYNIPAEFANEETKLYLNPVTRPGEYVTAVVEKEPSLLAKIFSTFSLILRAKAAGEEITAENVHITGVYTDEGGNKYYTLDTSSWSAFSGSTPYTYVAASDVTVDSAFETLDNQTATLTGTTVTLYRDVAIYEPEVSLGLITWEDSLTTGYGQMDSTTTAVFNHSPIALYEDYRGASGKYFEVDENTEITLTHYYEYSNGVIMYGASYTGDNAELAAALDYDNGTHPFVYVGDITLMGAGSAPAFTVIPEKIILNTADIPSTAITLDMKYTDENGEVWYGIAGGTSTWSTELAEKAEEGIYYIWIHEDDILPQDSVDADLVYEQLMGTETIEEWDEIINSYTDEELQSVGAALTDEQNQALTDHFDKLPTAEEKAVTDAYNALLVTATVKEYEELYAAVSDEIKAEFTYEMEDDLIAHLDALIDAEDTAPKNVTTYTKTAPFLPPVTVSAMQPISLFSVRNAMLLANTPAVAEADASTPVDNAAVVTDKNVVLNQDGTYKVTLESFVTGSKVTTSVSEVTPTDIIVVVDQSGSMRENMDKTVTYTAITDKKASEIQNNSTYRNNTYVNVGTVENPVYRKVAINVEYGEATVKYTPYSQTTTNADFYQNSSNLYVYEDDTYKKVRVSRDRTSGNEWSPNSNYKYTYSWDDYSFTTANDSKNNIVIDPQTNTTPQFYKRETEYTSSYKFSYYDLNGNQVTQDYNADDVVPTGTEETSVVGDKYYLRTVTEQERRLVALTNALTTFKNSVIEKTAGKDNAIGTADDVNHRIAIVGFSSDGYNNTEILTGCTIAESDNTNLQNNSSKYYPYDKAYNGVQYAEEGEDGRTAYITATSSALVDVSSKAGDTDDDGTYDGVQSVNNAIHALTAHGGTQTQDGTQMALDIWANDTYQPVAAEKRNRVVIVFTDGAPGNNGFSNDVANAAIADTKNIKADIPEEGETGIGYGATVYTVGIFDEANATVLINEDGSNAWLPNNLANSNKFMHFMSSNFKTAENMSTTYDVNGGTTYSNETFYKDKTGKYTGDSYYLSASDSESLNNIFEVISGSVTSGGSSSTLDETTVVKDIVAPNFQVPANATNVKTYTARATGKTGDEYTFATRVEDTSIQIEIVGTDVNVKGFDFSENWVGTETTDGQVSYRGKKLIIEFDIPVDSDFIGGNKVKTNGDDSGIYTPRIDENGDQVLDENNKPILDLVENFERPTVDIALENITATWQDQNIYVTNNADILALFTGATINGKTAAEVINGENNAYVDIAFTITGQITGQNSTTVGTYTIGAGNTFANGTWDSIDALNPALTEDTKYTISWTVTPTESGTSCAVSGSATANVYVYKPIITFQDLGVYVGEVTSSVKEIETAEDPTTVWKHGNSNAAEAPMVGEAPEITYSYSHNHTDAYINTTNDIPVQVTAAVGGKDITDYTTFTRTDHAKNRSDDAEFVLHVYRPVLTFKDSYEVFGNAPKQTSDYYNLVNNQNNMSNVVWESVVVGVTTEMISTAAPTLTLSYTPEIDPWVVDDKVTATEDFYVNVTVKAATVDITDFVRFVHEDYTALPDTHTECKYPFNTANGEFIIHIDILETDLILVKTVSADDYNADSSFVFDIEGVNKDNEKVDIRVVIRGTDFKKSDEETYSAEIVINAMRPKTSVTVTEDTAWSWEYSAQEGAVKTIAELSPTKGANRVDFVNKKEKYQWLTSEFSLENIFKAITSN